MRVEELADFVAPGEVFVLTGAGISTESGIPDYRLPDGTRRVIPMTFQEFRSGDEARRRYWSRSAVGWERFRAAAPNVGHAALARLQAHGFVTHLVTQNVDGLHQRAGSPDVVELHGSLAWVRCLECGERSPREDFQEALKEANPDLPSDALLLADGDADVSPEKELAFVLVGCRRCGSSMVKPDVVMFGETVPGDVVTNTFDAVERSRAVLVLGSSLKVMSGYRFVRRAMKRGQPVALVGLGTMRGEENADLLVNAPLGDVLTALCTSLVPPG